MEIQNNPQPDNSLLGGNANLGRNYQGRTEAAHLARWNWKDRDFRRIIAGTKIIKRLQKHALGQLEMNNSAVRAAIALLDRVVPVLQAVEMRSEHVHRFVLEVPAAALSSAEWEADTQSTQPRRQPSQTIEHSSS